MSLLVTGGALLGEYVAGKAADFLGSKIKGSVIERWSRYRNANFVQTFCIAVAEGRDGAEIEKYLSEVVNDEKKSAALFDAYRRVVLSASPELGPRIIALVTAQIIADNRQPTPDEEQVMAAAEQLSDSELIDTRNWFERYLADRMDISGPYTQTSAPGRTGGVNLWDEWGTWAGKLSTMGFISHTVRIAAPPPTGESNRINLLPRLETVLYFPGAIKLLAELITRSEYLTTTHAGSAESI